MIRTRKIGCALVALALWPGLAVADATTIACAQEQGEALGECEASLERGGTYDLTVTATFPNGFSRKLYFNGGAFVRANATMSGVGRDTDWQIKEGLHLIRVDDQRYEIPYALISGR